MFVPPAPSGETASERTEVFVNPELTAVQIVPLSVERRMPPRKSFPAKRLVPLKAKDRTVVFVKLGTAALQLTPLLSDEKMPV